MHKCFVLMIVVFLLTGCGEVELQNKEFAMTLGLDIKDEELQVIYDLPDLSKATQQEKEQEQEDIIQIQEEDLPSAQEEYQRSADKQLDFSHLKAIVISRQLVEKKESLEHLLKYLEGHNEVSQSVMVFVSESPKEVIESGSKKEGALGLYLEKLMSNKVREEQRVTVGKLISHWRNQNQVLVIPILNGIGESKIQIENGILLQNLKVSGELLKEEQEMLQLSKGKLIEKVYHFKDKPEICVRKARVSYKITRVSDLPVVTINILLRGEIKENTIKKDEDVEEVKALIANQIQEQLETLEEKWRLKEESIDLWNTFTMIGSRNRDLWEQYHREQAKYQKERKINFIIEWSGI